MTKNLLLWIGLSVLLVAVFQNISGPQSGSKLSYDQFISEVKSGSIREVDIADDLIRGKRGTGETFETIRPPSLDLNLLPELIDHNVRINGKQPERPSLIKQLIVSSFPILIILLIMVFFMRQMQGGSGGRGGPLTFGKSRARLMGEDQIKTTFADVAGVEEAKDELMELVEFLRDPGKFQRLGGKIPRGVLMVGPPGTGKTLLAKAIAGEAKVPFFTISGSDFVEMFVGVGASRVRDLFDQAKKQAPCIVFIDEIDAVGRSRGSGHGGGNDEREQTLNQLLVEMDGFSDNDGVIVIAATNRADVLDRALLRPGRFDRQVVVPPPDIRGREQILKVHMSKVPLGSDVDAAIIARGTPGFSGADLASLVNEAALFAARASKRLVGMEEMERAKDKILMGSERRSMAMSEKEKLNTAYHEAGHAIVGKLMPDHDPVYKVSVIPRGQALGVTMFLPEEDKYSASKRSLESRICGLFGGRIAEEIHCGADGVTTGASNDIERATELARNMVMRWGLSEKLGPLSYEDEGQENFFGVPRQTYSSETGMAIDTEVRLIIDTCYQRAEETLKEHVDKLHNMAVALMKYETIDATQIDAIMEGKEPPPPEGWDDTGQNGPTGGSVDTDKMELQADTTPTSESTEDPAPSDDNNRSTGPLAGPSPTD